MTQSPNRFTNPADLLIAAGESIKMQESAGIEPMCKFSGDVVPIGWGSLEDHAKYELPIAVVEGKPVFVGDELYCHQGIKKKVVSVDLEEGVFCFEPFARSYISSCSWNQPKPATVTFTLFREDAESLQEWIIAKDSAQERVMNAIREALEK